MKRIAKGSLAAVWGTTAIISMSNVGRALAAADTDNTGQLDEVVVTAQKRTSTVQDTPISMVAVTGADLQARGITSFANLAQATPGVSLKSEGPSQTEIEMRGMTSS
jgi:outer membrane receptor for ferrienterochelin and colicin